MPTEAISTMCDQVAGLTAISTGFDAVTMQSSINYMRAGRLEDCLTIEGFCVHDGRDQDYRSHYQQPATGSGGQGHFYHVCDR